MEDAEWRLRFRLLPLVLPIVVLPAFFVFAPWRGEPWFALRWALFAGERWNLLRLGSLGLGDLSLLLAAGAGAALFLRDAAPPLIDIVRRQPAASEAGPWGQVPPPVTALVSAQAARIGVAPPPVRIVRTSRPVLLCRGAREPELVISPATLEQLSPAELRAAVLHELAHVAARDPSLGHLLIGARALTFFNPAAQWAARAAVDEIERRADQATLTLGEDPQALAAAIGRLFREGHPPPVDGTPLVEMLLWRARAAGVERRRVRIITAGRPPSTRFAALRLALATAGAAALAFLTV